MASTPSVIATWFWSEEQELVQRVRPECAPGICHWAERKGEKDWSSLDLWELCQSGVVTPCDGVSEGGCDGHPAIQRLSLLSSKTCLGCFLRLVFQTFVFEIQYLFFLSPHPLSFQQKILSFGP